MYLRRRYPNQPAQYLLDKWDEGALDVLKKYNLGLDIRYTSLTGEIAERVHAAGVEVDCWTVITKEDGEALVKLGVDYITTNILE